MALNSRSIRRPSSEVVGAWQRSLAVAGSSIDSIYVAVAAAAFAANVFLTELLHAVEQTAPKSRRRVKKKIRSEYV